MNAPQPKTSHAQRARDIAGLIQAGIKLQGERSIGPWLRELLESEFTSVFNDGAVRGANQAKTDARP